MNILVVVIMIGIWITPVVIFMLFSHGVGTPTKKVIAKVAKKGERARGIGAGWYVEFEEAETGKCISLLGVSNSKYDELKVGAMGILHYKSGFLDAATGELQTLYQKNKNGLVAGRFLRFERDKDSDNLEGLE
ncbi:MAG: hypothetical protein FWC89_03255 [Defluviitaleaceae bacterium]|nr:hypothetical protein [Defluviitaleaceae bacterium]